MKTPFDPNQQISSIESKIIASLERVSQVFRVLLWKEGKENGLSPIQLQVLIFLRFHATNHRKITYLADEFNMTKATISDSVRVLVDKGLIIKTSLKEDSRSQTLDLTEEGSRLADKASLFANDLEPPLTALSQGQKEILHESLLEFISKLNKANIINADRMCNNCRFFSKKDEKHFCGLMNKSLETFELQIDCLEHEKISTNITNQ